MRHRFLFLAVVVAAAPALADDHPLLRPTRDVEVEYRTTGMPDAMPGARSNRGGAGDQTSGPAGGAGGTMIIHYTAKTGRIRIEAPNGAGYAIIDRQNHSVIVVMTQQHVYMEMPRSVTNDPNFLATLDGANTTFRKVGTDTIAGMGCTIYDATANGHEGQVCLSDDGVWLRAKGGEPNRAHEMEAIRVTYAQQADALFEPPADFQKMDIPALARGMSEGMPGGMPGGMSGGATGGAPQGMPGGTPPPR